jgi:hypothetical protein
VSDVINDVVGMLIGLGPVGAALLWCDLQDRFRHRANRVGADIRATANRVLGSESMLAVRVQPAIAWRPGRMHLSSRWFASAGSPRSSASRPRPSAPT